MSAHGRLLVNANPVLDLQGPVANADVRLASALVVPVAVGPHARGALALYAEAQEAFTAADAELALAAAKQLSRHLVPSAHAGDAASVMQAA